ncbi:MAG: lipid-binding SYLF domain-containing protein [Acidobacteriota bacterium]|nr:lipid-binding SYLF domain-containing protein [Acidobacteriota bacterium]
MKRTAALLAFLSPGFLFAASEASAEKRIQEAGTVFSEIMSAPDKGIPREILERAQCIGIVPNLKRVGFVVGAKYGKGVLTCRTDNGWSGPSTIRIEGGSIGMQIGAGETDLVFVVMNKSGQEKLLEDKFTFGGDASAMAGPVGRTAEAQTDAKMHAQILSYSRARGVFAGITLDGSTMRPDKEDNQAIYGHAVRQREILSGSVPAPAAASSLNSILSPYKSGTK